MRARRRRRSEKNTIVAVVGRLIRAVPRLGAASNGRARVVPAIIIVVCYINLEIIIIHIVGGSVSLHSQYNCLRIYITQHTRGGPRDVTLKNIYALIPGRRRRRAQREPVLAQIPLRAVPGSHVPPHMHTYRAATTHRRDTLFSREYNIIYLAVVYTIQR